MGAGHVRCRRAAAAAAAHAARSRPLVPRACAPVCSRRRPGPGLGHGGLQPPAPPLISPFHRRPHRPYHLQPPPAGLTQGWGTVAYKSPDEVLADVQLTWTNCRRYNAAGSPIK